METSDIKNMTQNDIHNFITNKLTINLDNKNTRGEVFTPDNLILEILNKFPTSVWSNPKLTWLDPACGMGFFPAMIFLKLDIGLAKWQPNKKRRHHHILSKMLFMVELDNTNVSVCRKLFGNKANIVCANFLTEESKWSNEFIPKQFDIIIGNPPFNSPKSESLKGGNESLWPLFVSKSLDLLAPSGYLSFIHPPGWRKPDHPLFPKLTHERQMLHLDIHGESDGKKTFGLQLRYDWYIVCNRRTHKLSTVVDQHRQIQEMDLTQWEFLPNHSYSFIHSILAKSNKSEHPPLEVIYSRNQYRTESEWTHETKTAKYKYPLIHSTPDSGIRYYWSSTKTPITRSAYVPMFGVSKVIFGDGRHIRNVITDNDGKYGMTHHSIGIKTESKIENERLKCALESEEFANILDAMSFSHYQIDWRIFPLFRKDFYDVLHIPVKRSQCKLNKTAKLKERRNKTRKIETHNIE